MHSALEHFQSTFPRTPFNELDKITVKQARFNSAAVFFAGVAAPTADHRHCVYAGLSHVRANALQATDTKRIGPAKFRIWGGGNSDGRLNGRAAASRGSPTAITIT
jgi:hypothetical protein